jgi:hypothetical protein
MNLVYLSRTWPSCAARLGTGQLVHHGSVIGSSCGRHLTYEATREPMAEGIMCGDVEHGIVDLGESRCRKVRISFTVPRRHCRDIGGHVL